MKGLEDADDNDIIILSDVDEIPNLNKLSEFNKNIMLFPKDVHVQIKLLKYKKVNWHGSKI